MASARKPIKYISGKYLEVIHQLFLYPSLFPVLRSCILLRPHVEARYRTQGQDAGMDTEITGE